MPNFRTASTLPFFTRAAPSRPKTSPPECSTTSSPPYKSSNQIDSASSPSSAHSTAPSTPPLTCPSLTSNLSWDASTFPETSYLLPTSPNGTWITTTTHALKHLSTTPSTLQWPHLYTKLANAAESASDNLQDSLNRAFEGRDLPAMHNKVINLVPSVSMPTMRQVSKSVDGLADIAQEVMMRRRGSMPFLDEEVLGDDAVFAHHMGVKAKKALVDRGIRKAWQVDSTRCNVHWQAQLEAALARLFAIEKATFSVAHLFAMTPVWTGDVVNRVWRLELDTGLVEVVVEPEWDELEERKVALGIAFALPERCGCLVVGDVEREVVIEGGWMAVE